MGTSFGGDHPPCAGPPQLPCHIPSRHPETLRSLVFELASASSAPVLISGETGTGKELVARTIHDMSTRAKGPFVAVNCSAIPETLLESELFRPRKGRFHRSARAADRLLRAGGAGTIFLDEITEMSPALQAKYLRMLRDGVAPRLGGKGELSVDVRVVAATNRDAAQAVQNRALHLLPPLRRRLEDLEFLVDAFITEFNEKYERQAKSVDHATMARLREHGWPGNARELIRRTLESVKNNKPRAAAILGTTPKTLHNKARRWRCEAAETAGS